MKLLPVLLGSVLFSGVGVAEPEAVLKSEYEKIRKERNEAPVFAARKMNADDVRFLERIKRDWELRSSEWPDPSFARISGLTGFSNDVGGVVKFYTHRTPPFSAEDRRRNVIEAVIAATLTVSLPITLDGLIHTGDGVAYIRNSKTTVTVFEDTGKGLKRAIYVKPPGE